MLKAILFFAVIIAGTLILILISNSSQKTQQVTPTPAQTLSVPTQTISSPSTIATTDATLTATTSAEISTNSATITTSKGNISIELYPDAAPKTVANFLSKANSGFYNNLILHRVEDWVIQGGDPKGDGTGGGNIPVEFNTKPFIVGSVGVASRGDGKVQNDAQFFITKKDASWLNGQYTNFGIVTKGMDVVGKITIGDKILKISNQ